MNLLQYPHLFLICNGEIYNFEIVGILQTAVFILCNKTLNLKSLYVVDFTESKLRLNSICEFKKGPFFLCFCKSSIS